jgi:hypothetical protein
MAHVSLNAGGLTPFEPSPLNVPHCDNKLRECTPAQDAEPFYYSVEDIIVITTDPAYGGVIKKHMAKFWGHTYPVWVGYKADGTVNGAVIALACPPYYKPHAFPGVGISGTTTPPEGFPTLATLPPEV